VDHFQPTSISETNHCALSDTLEKLGIDAKLIKKFKKIGIITARDLLAIVPKRYADHRRVAKIDELSVGQIAIVVAKIQSVKKIGLGQRQRLEIRLSDDTGKSLTALFFHAAYWDTKRYTPGTLVTVIGEISNYAAIPQMAHPRLLLGDRSQELFGLWGVYYKTGEVLPSELTKVTKQIINKLRAQSSFSPSAFSINAQQELESLSFLHQPPANLNNLEIERLNTCDHAAHKLLAMLEMFAFQLSLLVKRQLSYKVSAPLITKESSVSLFGRLFNFPATLSQQMAIEEISLEMARPIPMARLLQGDVGCGKTAVAASLCLATVQSGYQCALMAPTEVLAEQHFQLFNQIFSPLDIRIGFISSSVSGKSLTAALDNIAQGKTHIVIGTHSLLYEKVIFHRLGLCIIDEQHRFGVKQRTLLQQKGTENQCPHLLVMTATPIPRSLSLTQYGDLSISTIHEMPRGRKPVITKAYQGNLDSLLIKIVSRVIEKQEQAFIVYPLIEESTTLDLAAATKNYEMLSHQFGKEKIALLHGQMKADEKERIIRAFAKGSVNILLATTVIEVGINVPNATSMIIMNAERFGLAQLHQLRGRVGRGPKQSYCFLFAGEKLSHDGRRRLKVMTQSTDGFLIAQEDLAIRGPGDFLGTRQSGEPLFRFCDVTKHIDIIESARLEAAHYFKKDPSIKNSYVRGLLSPYFRYQNHLS